MISLTEQARAKVNLTLRVAGRRADGYHDLESVVAFADCADSLSLVRGEGPSLEVTGALAAQCGDLADNLVMRSARRLAEARAGITSGRFVLDKKLPVAAGIGGGSADAAAALRCLARSNGIAIDDPVLYQVAREVGADVPVCLASRACVMSGVGDLLAPLALPRLPCVLVNPRVSVSTVQVFTALGLARGERHGDGDAAIEWPAPGAAAEQWLAVLAAGRNDLEAPAIRIAPEIEGVLSALREAEGVALARMSGSGATCFAIFASDAAAEAAAAGLRRKRPQWWVHAGALS
ncbi:MAG TPA: 4-(cytidine 5'-diphospho)-2-C-methyl-D-erythritol kinase [Xanthobacteraceae bacterium]|nr:4-(cytidine 5'-diphospho)-2-C-methyl-D-erythritol kinase [Xanthobacteraceae bacterium]